jgi:hypothetical protein
MPVPPRGAVSMITIRQIAVIKPIEAIRPEFPFKRVVIIRASLVTIAGAECKSLVILIYRDKRKL